MPRYLLGHTPLNIVGSMPRNIVGNMPSNIVGNMPSNGQYFGLHICDVIVESPIFGGTTSGGN